MVFMLLRMRVDKNFCFQLTLLSNNQKQNIWFLSNFLFFFHHSMLSEPIYYFSFGQHNQNHINRQKNQMPLFIKTKRTKKIVYLLFSSNLPIFVYARYARATDTEKWKFDWQTLITLCIIVVMRKKKPFVWKTP